MTQWYKSCQWVLTAALAAQLAGCAQTAQWVGRWTGQNKVDEQIADIDGRGEKESSKRPGRVKIASSPDAAKKPLRDAGDEEPLTEKPDDNSRPDRKIAVAPGAEKLADRFFAQVAKKSVAPRDPFQDESPDETDGASSGDAEETIARDDRDTPPRQPTKNSDDDRQLKVAQRNRSLPAEDPIPEDRAEPDVREASHRASTEPDWTRGELPQGEGKGLQATEDPLAQKPIAANPAKNEPSATTCLELCPGAEGEVRELIRGLDDGDLEQVRRCLHRLGRMGPDASAALPAAERLLHHRDGNVQIHAALAICRIDGVSAAVLGTLTKELKASDPGERSFAAAVLAELGPLSGDVVPALADALTDRDPYVRLHVAEVLIRHDDWSLAALRTLLDCLTDRDENIRWLATYSLAELAPQSDEAVQALANRLKDHSEKVRIGAVYALGEIGGLSAPALGNLRRLDHEPNPELRSAVAYAIEQIEMPVESVEN